MNNAMEKTVSSSRSSQRGVSMVELMISATLGLIVMAGVTQIYINSKQSQRSNNAVFRLQENGRTAISIMTNTAQMTGYIADPNASSSSVFLAAGAFTAGAAITATNNDSDTSNDIKDNTDWFVVRYQGNSDDSLVLDCIGNALPSADPAFPNDVFPMVFGISDDNQLFCEPGALGAGSRITIADGVENLQLLYGVDSDADQAANFYVDADSVTDFSTVVNLRITFLVRSRDRVTTGPMAYTYNGVTTTNPGDRRMRFVFNTTITLKNISNG